MEVVDSRVQWQALSPTLLSIRMAVVIFEHQKQNGDRHIAHLQMLISLEAKCHRTNNSLQFRKS